MEGGNEDMTQVIDERVVEMKFNNADFEKNVAESMNTLDKLKAALNIDSAKSLQGITASANRVDLSNVGNAVETVKAQFSALQVVGITALSEITKSAMSLGASLISRIVEPIKSGGMNRALNIEQAKFQLEGLGVAWKDIEDDINYGVRDTAYGLDAAAKAASQLVASGVQLGDEMKAALRGISGVAAMTNSSFEEISPIFTTVAGQGKLMTMQLRQLESRGLNAAATLATAFGITEEEVRDMVTKGKIDFETFATAMDDAFGPHAKEANKTFTGAMSNVRAALSRIGANFATPYMENMRLIAVESIKVINQINKFLNPIYDDVSKIMEIVRTGITDFLKSSNVLNSAHSIIVSVRNAFYSILVILKPIKDAFREIFPKKEVGSTLREITLAIERFTTKLLISEETGERIRRTFRGVFAVLDIIGMAFKAAFDAIKPFAGGLGDVVSSLLGVTGNLGDFFVSLRDSIKENNVFENVFGKLSSTIQAGGRGIKEALDSVVDSIRKFKEEHFGDIDFSGFTNFIDTLKEKLPDFNTVSEGIGGFFEVLGNIFTTVGSGIIKGAELIGKAIGTLLKSSTEALGPGNGMAALFNTFSSVAVGTMFTQIIQWFDMFSKKLGQMGGLSPVLANVNGALKQLQADLKADVLMKLAKAIGILAASILVISLIEPSRLAQSLGAIELMIYTMSKMGDLLYSISNTKANPFLMAELGNSLVKVAAGVAILALAVKSLSSIDLDDLIKGMAAVEILMYSLVSVSEKLASNDKKMIKGAGTMIALAVAIKILASAVKTMAELDIGGLIVGLGGVVAMLYAVTKAVQAMDTKKLNVGTGVALIAIAAAIKILAGAVESLGSMDFATIIQGGVAVGLLLAALAGFVKFSSGAKNMVGVAIGLIAAAAALNMLVGVVQALGEMDLKQLVQGGIAIGAILTALALFSNFSSGGNMVLASAGLILFASAISSLTTSLERLGAMSIGDLIKAFVSLVVVVGALAGASVLLTPILPVMAGLSGVILLLGVGVLALGAGVVSLSAGLAALATSCTVVVANMGAIQTIISVLIPTMAMALANGVVLFVSTLAANSAILLDSVKKLLMSVLQLIIDVTPKIVETVKVVLEALLWLLVDMAEPFTQATIEFFDGFIEGITAALPRTVAAINNYIITLINTLADSLREDTPRFIAAFDNLMDAAISALLLWGTHFGETGANFVIKLVEGLGSNLQLLLDAGKTLIDNLITSISTKVSDAIQLGKDFLSGFIQGLKDIPLLGNLITAGEGLVTAAANAVQKKQKSNSPAKVTEELGEDFGNGYVEGIKDATPDVKEASKGMVDAAVEPVDDAADRIPGKVSFIEQCMNRLGISSEKYVASKDKRLKQKEDEIMSIDEETDAVNKETEAEDANTKATSTNSKAKQEKADVLSKLKDSLESQMDVFTKFELKTDITSQQMLENMKSNLDGFATWSSKLASLAERGISKALWEKLAEMGPKGYAELNAFVNMTDEQLQQANEMYAASMAMDDAVIAQIAPSYQKLGGEIPKGIAEGIRKFTEESTTALGETSDALEESFKERNEIHSPSQLYMRLGMMMLEGLRLGLTDPATLIFLDDTIRNVLCALWIIMPFQSTLIDSNVFYDIGKNITYGIRNGIMDPEAQLALDTAIEETAAKIAEIAAFKLEVKSPSRVMRRIGGFATMGLAIGIADAAQTVIDATNMVVDGAIDSYSNLNNINSLIDTSIDFNPVITPMLDLSYIRSQVDELDTMFSDPEYGLNGQNGATLSNQPQTISFTQNNYSPKSLSRYEIYKQTNRQLSAMRKVVTG